MNCEAFSFDLEYFWRTFRNMWLLPTLSVLHVNKNSGAILQCSSQWKCGLCCWSLRIKPLLDNYKLSRIYVLQVIRFLIYKCNLRVIYLLGYFLYKDLLRYCIIIIFYHLIDWFYLQSMWSNLFNCLCIYCWYKAFYCDWKLTWNLLRETWESLKVLKLGILLIENRALQQQRNLK